MQRNIEQLTSQEYDVVVIGAGIYGASIARDAALRGLKVAIIDKGDFCGKTSHNSLKIIHGGIRYLQHLDIKRTLESIHEQRVWLSVAPHLVRPMKCLMPTFGHAFRGPEVMWAGVKLYQLMSWVRGLFMASKVSIPAGEILSRGSCEALLPDINEAGLTGAAVWYDAQAIDADKAVLEMISSAVDCGAHAANYVEARSIVRDGARVLGLDVRDCLGDKDYRIKSRLVVNAAGPWAEHVLAMIGGDAVKAQQLPLIQSMNIVTHRLFGDYAVALKSRLASDSLIGETKRLYFFTPWKNCSVIGTTHFPYNGNPDDLMASQAEVEQFIGEINQVYSGLNLTADDVKYCYKGLTPAADAGESDNRSHHGRIIDHSLDDGVDGMISVIGVKYTTARLVAEQAVNLLCAKLGGGFSPCKTRTLPLPGAGREPVDVDNLQGEQFERYCQELMQDSAVVNLADLIFRRMDLAARGVLDSDRLQRALAVMASMHDWDGTRSMQELQSLKQRWLGPEMSACIAEVEGLMAA